MSYLNVYFDEEGFVKVYPINCRFIDLVRQYKILVANPSTWIDHVNVILNLSDNFYTIPLDKFHISDPNINPATNHKMFQFQELPNK